VRILLLSRYGPLGASSRLRSYQYLPYLISNGFEITVAPLFGDDYVAELYRGKVSVFGVMCSYFSRIMWLWRARKFDLIWVEKEALPWLPSWIELSLLPSYVSFVVDYDDALFHKYDQHRWSIVRLVLRNKIDAVMRQSNMVLVGNNYLGTRAKKAGARRIEWLPTVVNFSRYFVAPRKASSNITIGWIGSPSTAKYLKLLVPVLMKLVAAYDVRIVAVGANADQLRGLPIEVHPWSEACEVSEIQQFDIGVMPLPDEPFERGKCGYKLIQYMACGKPVVASPIGVNKVIVRDGVNGFLASTLDEWEKYLRLLCDSADLCRTIGVAGRELVESEYSLQIAAPRLESLLRSVEKRQ
jgi:glycosyltransferase involved in cell wall biosynthesis